LADGVFGMDDAIMDGIECHWWKFWRRLRDLNEQLPRPVALVAGFEVPTGGSALSFKVQGFATLLEVMYCIVQYAACFCAVIYYCF
jgi:hypothetical protein